MRRQPAALRVVPACTDCCTPAGNCTAAGMGGPPQRTPGNSPLAPGTADLLYMSGSYLYVLRRTGGNGSAAPGTPIGGTGALVRLRGGSEEHTSELQSLR